jgi:hypothetical protein
MIGGDPGALAVCVSSLPSRTHLGHDLCRRRLGSARSIPDLGLAKRVLDFGHLQLAHALDKRVERPLAENLHQRAEAVGSTRSHWLGRVTQQRDERFRHGLDLVF